MDSRVEKLQNQPWLGEATKRYGEGCDDSGDRKPIEPIDFSWIVDLFNACDPAHADYDRELHMELYREKPLWFGGDGLPLPEVIRR